MNNDKKGILHPFIKYLIETKQLEIIIEEESNNLFIEKNED
ncbi:hypothetical protein [Spiroplasma endosymbiont of Polydrusus pterygomalis]